MRQVIVFIGICLLTSGFIMTQAQTGVYKMQDGQILAVSQMDSHVFMVYNNGDIRGLRATSPGHFESGNSFGKFDQMESSLDFSSTGDKVIWKREGSEITGNKISFNQKDVSFSNRGTTLAGTLILPEGTGPFPCIVFTHGSGAETRDGNLGLAYFFAANGIGSMIYDKRGTGKSSGKEWQDSFDNYACDAIAAAELVAVHPLINKKKIGIYGHSQGGWIAPLAVSKSKLFSFAIISAANAITPVEQHLAAGDEEYRLMGMDEDQIKEVHAFRLVKYEVGITGKGKSDYRKKLAEAESKPWFKTTGGTLPENFFWKANGFYDPLPALKAMTCPVMVIYGTLDISTSTERNLPLMKRVLGNNAEYLVLENANHMLMKVDKKGYATKQLPFVTQFGDGYLDAMIHWTRKVIE